MKRKQRDTSKRELLPHLQVRIHNADEDIDSHLIEYVLMLGLHTSAYHARDFVINNNITSVDQLREFLPRKKRTSWIKFLLGVVQRWEGSYDNDPHARDCRDYNKNRNRSRLT